MNATATDDDKLLDGLAGIADRFLPASTEDDRVKNRRTVQHWIDNHDLPVTRVGRRLYGKVSTIKAWLDKQEAKNHG